MRQRTFESVSTEIATATGTNWYAGPSGRLIARPAVKTPASMRNAGSISASPRTTLGGAAIHMLVSAISKKIALAMCECTNTE